MIKVIEQTTSERNAETKELFHQIKPYLDEGYSYNKACCIVKGLNHHELWKAAWYRDVVKYGETQGYRYDDHMRSKHNGMGA